MIAALASTLGLMTSTLRVNFGVGASTGIAAEGAFSFTEPVISSDSHLSTLPVITSTSTSETYPGSTEVNDMSTWTFPTSYEDHTGTISLSTGTVTVSTLTRKKRPHDTKIENPHHNNHHIETTNETCTETGITSSVSKYTAPTPCTAMPSNETWACSSNGESWTTNGNPPPVLPPSHPSPPVSSTSSSFNMPGASLTSIHMGHGPEIPHTTPSVAASTVNVLTQGPLGVGPAMPATTITLPGGRVTVMRPITFEIPASEMSAIESELQSIVNPLPHENTLSGTYPAGTLSTSSGTTPSAQFPTFTIPDSMALGTTQAANYSSSLQYPTTSSVQVVSEFSDGQPEFPTAAAASSTMSVPYVPHPGSPMQPVNNSSAAGSTTDTCSRSTFETSYTTLSAAAYAADTSDLPDPLTTLPPGAPIMPPPGKHTPPGKREEPTTLIFLHETDSGVVYNPIPPTYGPVAPVFQSLSVPISEATIAAKDAAIPFFKSLGAILSESEEAVATTTAA